MKTIKKSFCPYCDEAIVWDSAKPDAFDVNMHIKSLHMHMEFLR